LSRLTGPGYRAQIYKAQSNSWAYGPGSSSHITTGWLTLKKTLAGCHEKFNSTADNFALKKFNTTTQMSQKKKSI
jgi:hypothetical protein